MEFEELIERARQGDPQAVDELFRRFSPAVLHHLRGQLGPALRRRYDTDDLGQSVLAEAIRDLPNFRAEHEGAFRKWLWLKARSNLWMKLRRELDREGRRREQTWNGRERTDYADPADGAAAAEDRALLDAALEELDPVDREIVLLRDRDDLPYKDIAVRTRLPSADAARMRYARAVLRLREQWRTR